MSMQISRSITAAKLPEPDLGHELIPKDRYLSPTYAQLEWDRMWTKVWHCAGAASDVAERGDYFVYEVGPESVLVVNTGETVQAVANVCQHRGRTLREPGCGTAASFQCPYHLWTYALDGTLVDVPDRGDFPQGDPTGRCNLPRIRCEVWNGFVWVNLDPACEPLRDYLGIIADHLESYDFGRNYHLRDEMFMEWECNWKIGVDAFNEVYHVQGIHPELLDFTDDVDCPVDILGRHSRFLFRVGRPSPRWTDELAHSQGYRDRFELTAVMKGMMRQAGVDPDTFAGALDDIRPAIQRARRASGPGQGFDYSTLIDDQLTDDFHYFIFPNITLNISANHFWWFRHRPHPSGDPNRMMWDYQDWVRLPAGREPPERPATRITRFGDGSEKDLHLALQQDGAACPPLQRGMRSGAFNGLELAHQERRIRNFHRVLESYVAGEPVPQDV